MEILYAVLAATRMFLVSYNTMAGTDRDIQTGDQKLENSADSAKQKI